MLRGSLLLQKQSLGQLALMLLYLLLHVIDCTCNLQRGEKKKSRNVGILTDCFKGSFRAERQANIVDRNDCISEMNTSLYFFL